MPAVEAALARFRASGTQVMGVSIDSVHSHANWGKDLGGVSFPLLADFQPKGAVAKSFGHYLDGPGIGDRATVLIDREGVVRYSVSVTPAGERNIDELVAECEKIGGSALAAGQAVPAGTKLFVKSACGHSRRALLAVDNLGLQGAVEVCNVTDDTAAAKDLVTIGGKDQAPCLVLDNAPIYEAPAIVQHLAERVAPLV